LLQKTEKRHELGLKIVTSEINKDENKLSWADTYKAMAGETENWNDFDVTLLDGLEEDDIAS